MSTDSPLSDLPDDIHPDVAAVIFATEFDDTIKSLLGALDAIFESGQEDLEWAMEQATVHLQVVAPLEAYEQMTIESSKPYVEISDLIISGLLAHRLYSRTTALTQGPSKKRDR